MQDAYTDIAGASVSMGAESGAAYYELAGGTGLVAPTPPDEALQASARWAMTRGDSVTGLQLLSNSLAGRIYSAAQDSVQLSAEAEPGAKWARRARADACGFCKMVATRGDVYASAESAMTITGRGKAMSLSERRSRAQGHTRGAGGKFLAGGTKTRGSGKLGSRYHDKCRCLAVAVRPGQTYSPPSYIKQWEEEYKGITREVGTDPNAIAKRWQELASA